MTRETKIGLFVGMGVIILIGILISDHLSVAQRQQQPDFGSAFAESDVAAADPVAPPNSTPVDPPAAPTPPRRAEAPAPDRLRVDVPAAVAERPRNETPVLPPGGAREAPSGSFEVVDSGALTDGEVRTLEQRLRDAASPSSRTRTHTVAEGESLSQIARTYYGRTALWSVIHEHNRDVIPDPNRLKAGTQLVIPDTSTPALAAETSQPAAPAPSTTQYTLKKGETLAFVAEKFLGSQGKWPEILEFNKDRVSDPTRLQPGTVLRIPQR